MLGPLSGLPVEFERPAVNGAPLAGAPLGVVAAFPNHHLDIIRLRCAGPAAANGDDFLQLPGRASELLHPDFPVAGIHLGFPDS